MWTITDHSAYSHNTAMLKSLNFSMAVLWTITDHSAYSHNTAMLKFKDPELKFTDSWSWRQYWYRFDLAQTVARMGVKPAGNTFEVTKSEEEEDKVDVFIHRFQRVDYVTTAGSLIGVLFILLVTGSLLIAGGLFGI